MKKLCVILFAFLMIITIGTFITHAEGAVCEIVDGAPYATFKDAIDAAADGQTIRMLSNYTETQPVVVNGKTVYLDLGNYDLTIDVTAGDAVELAALEVSNGGALLQASSAGKLNILLDAETGVKATNGAKVVLNGDITTTLAWSMGVYAEYGSEITINGDIASEGEGIVPMYDSKITVTGNITATHGIGVDAHYGGKATVIGEITGGSGARASGAGSEITVSGNIETLYGGAFADSGGKVTIEGDITSNLGTGVSARDAGTGIKVIGNITAGYNGIFAIGGAQITSTGSVIASPNNDKITSTGVYAEGTGTVIAVNGDVTGGAWGAMAAFGGKVTIHGNVIDNTHYGVEARGSGAEVIVNGDVMSENNGLYAWHAKITVNGNVIAGLGAYAMDEGTEIIINGNVTANGFMTNSMAIPADYCGIGAQTGAKVTVNGNVVVHDDGSGAVNYVGATSNHCGVFCFDGGTIIINGTLTVDDDNYIWYWYQDDYQDDSGRSYILIPEEKTPYPSAITISGIDYYKYTNEAPWMYFDNTPSCVYIRVQNSWLTSGGSNVKLEYPGGVLPAGTTMTVNTVSEGLLVELYQYANYFTKPIVGFTLYDIKLWHEGSTIQPSAPVKLYLPLPANFDPARFQVCYVNPDDPMNPFVPLQYTIEDNYAVVETDHFSLFGFVELGENNTPPQPQTFWQKLWYWIKYIVFFGWIWMK
ncbi:MAG: hypothetical protein FWH26_00555 [Oscillospiraceae bacterium]|nr:hypothetical protein [Oscillospiraceae bacterium]